MSIILEGIDLPKDVESIDVLWWDKNVTMIRWERLNADRAIQIPRTLSVVNVKRGWIPVSELLPEEDRPVLVAVKTKDRLPKWIEKQTYHYVTDIDVYDEDNGWMENGKDVVAWQPLPAPYKGE